MTSESTNFMIGPRQNLNVNVKVWQLIARKILSRDLERSALKGPGKRKETSSDRLETENCGWLYFRCYINIYSLGFSE